MSAEPQGQPERTGHEHGKQPPRKREPMEDVAAQAIREAMERGEFDNLPGKGKPLNLFGDLADAKTMASKLRSNAGFRSAWDDLGIEIDKELQRAEQEIMSAFRRRQLALQNPKNNVEAIERQWQGALAALERQVGQLNSKILKFNLLVPPQLPHLYRVRLRFDAVLEKLGITSPTGTDS